MNPFDVIPDDAPAKVSASDLARWVGCHINTIHRWRQDGLLPAPFIMGGFMRWDREQLRAFFRKQGNAVSSASSATSDVGEESPV